MRLRLELHAIAFVCPIAALHIAERMQITPLNIKGITRLSFTTILNRSLQTDIVFWEMVLINFASVGVNWLSNHAGRSNG
jgi:hypothetical protein